MEEKQLPTQKSNGAKTTQPKAEVGIEEALKRIEELQKQLKAVQAIQDQGMLAKATVESGGDARMRQRVRIIDGKIVQSWTNMKVNDVRIINGDIVENQQVALLFQDGTSKEMSYKDFTDSYSLSPYLPVSRILQDEKGRSFELELEDGSLIIIGELFLN